MKTKNTVRHHYIPIRMVNIKKDREREPRIGEDVEDWNSPALLVGMQMIQTSLETIYGLLLFCLLFKLNIHLQYG